MRRMYSENQIKKIIEESPAAVLEALKGQALSVAKINADNAEIFENISDSKGHLRFVEGDGVPVQSITGFTSSYCKWSLSGTHLMMILIATIENGTVINGGSILARFYLPQWILDKVISIASGLIEYKSTLAVDTAFSQQNVSSYLYKGASSDNVVITLTSTFTASSTKTVKIQYDLLIDNASEE